MAIYHKIFLNSNFVRYIESLKYNLALYTVDRGKPCMLQLRIYCSKEGSNYLVVER